MKRLLALILALMICFSFLVSCNEEEQSSSSSQKSSSSSSNDKEISSKLTVPYTCHRIAEGIAGEVLLLETKHLDKWIFNDYESYIKTMQTLTRSNGINCITEDMFVDNFVIVVFRGDDFREIINSSYHSISKNTNGKYSLIIEYETLGNMQQDWEHMCSLDALLIPRSEADGKDVCNLGVSFTVKEIKLWEME